MRLHNPIVFASSILLCSLALAPQRTAQAEDFNLTPLEEANRPKVVNLLELVDPTQDVAQGKWVLKDGKLVASNQPSAKINLPYQAPEEYDLHVQLVRTNAKGDVFIVLTAAGRQFGWLQSGYGNAISGFERIDDVPANKNPTRIHSAAAIENGKPYDIILKVRKAGLEAWVNGDCVCRWRTSYSNMTLAPNWQISRTDALGLVVKTPQGDVIFSKVEIRDVTGVGKILKHGDNAMVRTPANTPPSRPIPPAPSSTPEKFATARIPIDIPVAAAKPDPNAKPAANTPPANPDAIERPYYRNKPKALVKSISSVTALVVQTGDDGDMMGMTTDIIATVNPDSRLGDTAGIGILRADGDPMMKTALDEAVRAVRLRYPIWEPGHIDLSFGEKFVSHGGPSAGTAFGLLMLSTLEGFELDPKCAVTGDITVDWKVRKVGGVTAKLHGAMLDKCLYAAIPEDNETAFADMALLYGDSALWDIQVFSIATMQDAEYIARKDRSAKLVEAIKLFDSLKPKLAKSEKAALHDPATQKTLQRILELAPNHLSAKYLLAIADGSAAKTLSANATIYRLGIIFYPFRRVLDAREKLSRATLAASVTLNARKQLAALRPIANKDFRSLLTDESAFIESMDEFASSPNGASVETLINRAGALDARVDELDNDKDLRGKLMREGY